MCTFEIRTDPTACCCTVQLLSTWLLDLEWTDFFTQIIPRIFFIFPRFIKVTMTTFDQYRLQYIPLMEQFHEINQSLILTPKMYTNVQMFYCWLVQVYIFSIFLWSLFCQWAHFFELELHKLYKCVQDKKEWNEDRFTVLMLSVTGQDWRIPIWCILINLNFKKTLILKL